LGARRLTVVGKMKGKMRYWDEKEVGVERSGGGALMLVYQVIRHVLELVVTPITLFLVGPLKTNITISIELPAGERMGGVKESVGGDTYHFSFQSWFRYSRTLIRRWRSSTVLN